SGQVGWLARDRWGVPLVHTAHTLARVKNASLARGDTPEPRVREIGEQQVTDEADRLVANTADEARQLVQLYGADPGRVDVIAPGVDLARFTPPPRAQDRARARESFGLRPEEAVLAFVGRLQTLKGPEVLLRAAAELVAREPARRVRVLVTGGSSGSGSDHALTLQAVARTLGIVDVVTFLPPQTGQRLVDLYRAADVVAVPSYSESFGLVALEAQACGTPVVAADVGGLGTAVADGVSGVLVGTHRTGDWADALSPLLDAPLLRARLAAAAPVHAAQFSWDRTADALLDTYALAAASVWPARSAMLSAEVRAPLAALRGGLGVSA
ncbi:MAG: glycosyltransferase, partial [Mycobacteriaceae bacterium]